MQKNRFEGMANLHVTVEIVYNEHEDQADFARYNRFSL